MRFGNMAVIFALFLLFTVVNTSDKHYQNYDISNSNPANLTKNQKLKDFRQSPYRSTFQESIIQSEIRNQINNSTHRSLAAASATNSVVAGLESSSMFIGDTLNIIVTAKNSGGNLILTGGDIFTIKISNLCNKYNNYNCDPAGTAGPLSKNINDVLTDHNNGTYTYSYALQSSGSISVQIYLLSPNKVYQESYSMTNTCGRTPLSNIISSSINIPNGAPVGGSSSPYYPSYIYIIGAIKAPADGTVNFSLSCDDYCLMSIEDTQSISSTCSSDCCSSTCSPTLVQNKYYTFFIRFSAVDSDYEFSIYWSYSTTSSTQIPMSSVFLPNLVSSSPYTINVALTVCGDQLRTGTETCDDGNTANGDGCSSTCTVESGFACMGGSTTSKDTCTEICGDGIRFNTISTYCDDKNNNSGDGCSSICTVESGYKCSGGSTISKDTCSLIFEVTTEEEVVAKSTQIATGAGASANAGASLLSMSSPVSVFSMMNQFQLLYIILVCGAYVSDGVFSLITGLNISLFDFNFIKIEEISFFKQFYSYLSIEQTNISLNRIGIVSGSSFVTFLKLILVITIIILFHAIFMPVHYVCKKLNQRNICARIGIRLYSILTFNIYVRIIIQVYITILLSCFGEIYEFKAITGVQITLYCINIIICVAMTIFYVLCLRQIKKAHPKLDSNQQFYFIEFFSGLKNKTICRIYPAVFLGQRFISCLLVIMFARINLTIKMSILSLIQLLSMLHLLIARPYEKVKDQLTECISQGIMTLFCCILIHFNTKDQWNSYLNWTFMLTLMTSTIISSLIAFIDIFIIIYKKIKGSCCNTNKVDHLRANHQIEISNIGPNFSNVITREHESQIQIGEENKSNNFASEINFISPSQNFPKKSIPH